MRILLLSQEAFHKMEVRVRTKLYFTQQKFNLLREESEGYSKIITELNQGDAFRDEVGVLCDPVIQRADLGGAERRARGTWSRT